MEQTIFGFIRRFSMRQQIVILTMTLVSFPFLYVSLELPKIIINEAIAGANQIFPKDLAGVSLTQVQFLLFLCLVFLALVFVNGGFKFQINVYKGIVAERLLRRLRYILLSRAMLFPLAQFRKTSQGELVAMVTAEVEPLGGFLGDAFALPLFQGGTFATILAFMFVQDPWLGLAAILLIPVQVYVVPRLQRRVNDIGKERVRHVRRLSDRIGEVVSGMGEVHAHDASGFVLSDFSKRLGDIFYLRFDIYKKKFFIKFLNNFLNQMTPFFFFSVGGYLVILESLTFGALVAALAAYKDLAAPWKELLNYYQRMADARIKYADLTEQFKPAGMMDEALQRRRPETIDSLRGPIAAKTLTLVDEDGFKVVDSATFSVAAGSRTAVVGAGGSGKEALAQLLARLVMPSAGKLSVGNADIASLPQAVIGARVGYASGESYIFAGTIMDNLLFGLKHRPNAAETASQARRSEVAEALASGNSTDDVDADWIDYEGAGVPERDRLAENALEVLDRVDFTEDLFRLGLRQKIDPEAEPELAAGILEARRRIGDVLAARGAQDLVRQYRSDAFNPYASVGANILFGQPASPEFAIERLSRNALMLRLLGEVGLTDRFLDLGLKAAKTMVELFANLPPGHPFFEQYSFVDEDGLARLQKIVRRLEGAGPDELGDDDRAELVGLPFMIVPSRHRLGLIDDDLRARLLELRHRFRKALADGGGEAVRFFDETAYNAGLDIEANILCGSIAHGISDAEKRVEEIVGEIVNDLQLRAGIMKTSLRMEVGNAGGRLAAAQRQKLATARSLIKNPEILIVNEALSALDGGARSRVLRRISDSLPETTIVWVDSELPPDFPFDTVLSVKNGRVTMEGEVTREAAAAAEPERLTGLAETLAGVPLLAGLDRPQLKLLVFTSQVVRFGAGETIIQQGDTGDSAYIVIGGKARVTVSRDGEERYIRTVSDNEVVGELALICDMPRSASIRAETDVEVLRMQKEVFLDLIGRDRHASFVVLREIGNRLAAA